MNQRKGQHGYLLLEAIVAMGVLSAGVITVNESLHRAMLLRATSDDYTKAAFLLGDVMGPLEVQYDVPEGSLGDKCKGFERFSYNVKVENYDLPAPAIPAELPPELLQALEEAGKNQLRKITATISWTRARQSYKVTAQTVVLQKPEWTDPQLGPAQNTTPQQNQQRANQRRVVRNRNRKR